MDSRLFCILVLVTFAWMSVGTNAQTNSTLAPNSTLAANATVANTTLSPSNTTATTAAPTTTTTAAPTTTTTAAPTTTTTIAPTTTTTAAPTTTTTITPTTTTITPTTSVQSLTAGTLQVSINKSGCGSSKLCAQQPSNCDPGQPGSCFFISTAGSGSTFHFELAGVTSGYIAASVSVGSILGGNATTYVCANSNGNVQFFGALLNNNALTLTPVNANSVSGRVRADGQVQCVFNATVPTTATRATLYALAVLTGSYTGGSLGTPTFRIVTNPVDLSNPNSNISNLLMSSGHALTFPLTQALLVVVGMTGLAIL